MPNHDKQPGDNRPGFVAPINPKSPAGKTWRIGAKIGNTWYNQATLMIRKKMEHLQVD